MKNFIGKLKETPPPVVEKEHGTLGFKEFKILSLLKAFVLLFAKFSNLENILIWVYQLTKNNLKRCFR